MIREIAVLGIAVLLAPEVRGIGNWSFYWENPLSGKTSEYTVVEEKTDYFSAATRCIREFDGQLASLSTETEAEHVKIALLEHKQYPTNMGIPFWVGLLKTNSLHWRWINGETYSFEDWSPTGTEPSGDGACGELRTEHLWRWNDTPCKIAKFFICETPL